VAVAQYVVPDAEKLGSSEPKTFPDLDIHVPVKVADSGRTRKEWDDLIKKHKLPLIIHDEKEGD
jgi:hypothetical protein